MSDGFVQKMYFNDLCGFMAVIDYFNWCLNILIHSEQMTFYPQFSPKGKNILEYLYLSTS